MPILLTREQRAVVDELAYLERPIQTLGGYAGTGKTTVIKTLIKRQPRFAVMAFTGKAANVLRRKGVPAATIHSTIYNCQEKERKDASGKIVKDVVFAPKKVDDITQFHDGFIVDEASMVGRQLYDDIVSFDLPVIFVGDHGQLEPVGSGGFNLMAHPDLTLEKVHRNAGEILHFANFLRDGNEARDWPRHELATGEAVQLGNNLAAFANRSTEPDQMICAFNKTRVDYNKLIRDILGYPADRPVVGDRIMCLRNNSGLGVFNGMQGTLAAILGDDELVFESDGEEYRTLFIPEQFNRAKVDAWDRSKRLPFDYAYVITAHKAQGDEWDHVLVVEQKCGKWDHARWAYTAASRARKELSWVPA